MAATLLCSPHAAAQIPLAACDHEPENVDEEAVRAEQERVQRFARAYEYRDPPMAYEWGDWFSDYQSEAAVDAYLDTLHELAPNATRVETVGTSYEGRPIRAIVFDSHESTQDSIVVLGTQHAREWASPMVVSCLADALARRADLEDDIRYILDRVEVAFIPMVNPDGYAYTRSDERMWRKNRNGTGVDLNRNWGTGWELTNSGSSSDTYPGTAAFSEPETAAVSAFVMGMPQLKLFLDYHSAAQDITYPYAYTSTPPENFETLFSWATDMAAAVTAVHGVAHGTRRTGMGGPAGGLAHDWAVAELGVIGMTPELRSGSEAGGFGMPPEDIIPTCEENLAGFLEVAMKVADEAILPEEPGGVPGSGGATTEPSSGGAASGGTISEGTDGPNTDGGAGHSGTDSPSESDPDQSEESTGDEGGCSCRAAPGETGSDLAWLTLLPLAAFLSRRRRLA